MISFKLDPAFFCYLESITEALEGDWKYVARTFLSCKEEMEADRLDQMEDKSMPSQRSILQKLNKMYWY